MHSASSVFVFLGALVVVCCVDGIQCLHHTLTSAVKLVPWHFITPSEMARPVELKVYDISGGLAAALSMQLLGKKIDGIWHTGVVVGAIEFFFGQGIQQAPASATPFGRPLETIHMGITEIPDDMIQDFLRDLAPKFSASTYDLMKNNCNNFSDALCDFLVGKGVPAHITGLPQDVLNSPMGPMLMQMLQPSLQAQLGNATTSGIATPAFQPAAASTPSAPTTSAATTATNTSASTGSSTSNSSRSFQNGTVSGRRKYKVTLEEEFKKVMGTGETDPNKAAVEAVRRVSALVKEGMVEPPESQS